MQPTIREVLTLPVMATGRPHVIGGREHLDRPVRWVHISDLADLTDLLEGGELVLTTGLPLAGGARQASAYLAMLAEQGVAGLVVELGTHLKTAPDHLGHLADSARLPVAVLNTKIRFIEVTQQVHRLIVADQYDEVEFARTTHEVFTSLNIARASITDIVTRAATTLGAPLVLEDLSRHVLAFCAVDTPTAHLLDQWAERSRLHDSAGTPTSGSTWSAVPVGVGSERWGRLVLPMQAPNASRARMVLERAAQSLQLHRMIQQEREALVVHALGGLLDDLLSGRITDDAEARARASALGLTPSTRYVPLSVRVPRRPDTDALGQGEIDRRLLAAVRQAAAAAGQSAIAAIRREGTVSAIMSCPASDSTDAALGTVCTGLRERLTGHGGADGWVAGTAPAAQSLIAAAQGLTEAEHVADVGLTMPDANRLYRSTDVRLRGLVALLRNDHRVQAFAETELGRLLDHDARTGEDLLALLRTYLDCAGSKTLTARLTGLSRPTLYSRLRTIERILRVSLDSAESRTSLHTALMIVDAR
ncbi:PucR family transcriptional regulator [Streptomyces sp. 3N207]|uniref:PucR family transcriptional regulator n=1 Tax=Streptomyces sp. 3N207 TaxID=3457417 RepID=UPI003FD17365